MEKDDRPDEAGYSEPISRHPVDSDATVQLTKKLDQMLDMDGDEREGFGVDVSWDSYDLGAHLVLLRQPLAGYVQYILYITSHEHNDEGDEVASVIAYVPGSGVVGIRGAICEEIAKFGGISELDLAESVFMAYIETYGNS